MHSLERARRLIAEEQTRATGFLDLGNLGLSELPQELLELTQLRSLNLGSWFRDDSGKYHFSANGGARGANILRSLPPGIGALRHLTALFLTDSGLADLTPLQHFPALQLLDCSGMQVSDLTPLRHVPALQSFNCSGTQVSDLRPLQHVPVLQSLTCSHTQVSDLRPLQHVPALQSLDCSHTEVNDLTPLQHVPSLYSLDCSHTQVSELKPLQHVPALQVLDCSGTLVSDLTPLVWVEKLSYVAASRCPLSDLPLSLVRTRTITWLGLHGIAVPGLPVEVLSVEPYSNCLAQLRDHLDDLRAGEEQVRVAKLVVVGNGRVGKTQLCRRLRGLKYDDTVPSTHGITVTSENSNSSADTDTLNIWDFGGQDIYHGVHTLFMKTRAVFLVVWHPDFEAGDEASDSLIASRNYPLPYWLDYVHTLARTDCPIVVVQSRCERPEQEVRRLPVGDRDLDRHRSLKPCWYSAKTNRGRGALNDALGDAIASLREREGVSTIGAGRMRVLQRLEAWRQEDVGRSRHDRLHRTLTQDAFRSLCDEAGGIRSPESLLDYLHNLGVVFYQPALFHDRIILDQSWALEAVYAVFDRARAVAQITGQGGRFTRSFLDLLVWHDYSEAEQRLFLSLMESCGICFVSRGEDRHLNLETEYIAPDLLPDKAAVASQLAGRWDESQQTWRLEYEYPFLHQGLMRALICDIGERAHDAGVYWKYGAWVYEKGAGCRVLIEKHMHDNRRGGIKLQIQGRSHQDLARWLRERIEARNSQFGHQDLVPSIDELDALAPLPHRGRVPVGGFAEPGTRPSFTLQAGVNVDPTIGGPPTAPTFEKPPASLFPRHSKQVFVSYAWGDGTDAGKQRSKIVDDLCDALRKAGAQVHRDSTEMRPGDRISEFMNRLAGGDHVVVVISDKYLRSENCMYELFQIFRNCAADPKRFVRRIIPLVLPDAALDSIPHRLARAKYWVEQHAQLRPEIQKNVDAVGNEVFKKYKLIGEFARNTSDMLEHLIDILEPRDFDRMAKEGFREILAQIRE